MISRPLFNILALPTAFYLPAAYGLDTWQPLPEGTVTRVAFGSCAKQWEPQPIWTTIIDSKPDLFLLLGDNIYGDSA